MLTWCSGNSCIYATLGGTCRLGHRSSLGAVMLWKTSVRVFDNLRLAFGFRCRFNGPTIRRDVRVGSEHECVSRLRIVT